MNIDWLTLARSINWPQVVASLALGGIVTYFVARHFQRRPQKSEFTVTALTTSTEETDITSTSMQFQVGAKGDLQNVNIPEIAEVVRQVLAREVDEEDKSGRVEEEET